MRKGFNIIEKPLDYQPVDRTAGIEKLTLELIKSRARLANQLENETEKAERWGAGLLCEVLEIADSLERILKQAEKLPPSPGTEKLEGHIRTVYNQLSHILQQRDVVPFESLGKQADPALTEIIDSVVREDCLDEEVVEEVEKGYLYQGNLLRRAKVIIAVGKEENNHD